MRFLPLVRPLRRFFFFFQRTSVTASYNDRDGETATDRRTRGQTDEKTASDSKDGRGPKDDTTKGTQRLKGRRTRGNQTDERRRRKGQRDEGGGRGEREGGREGGERGKGGGRRREKRRQRRDEEKRRERGREKKGERRRGERGERRGRGKEERRATPRAGAPANAHSCPLQPERGGVPPPAEEGPTGRSTSPRARRDPGPGERRKARGGGRGKQTEKQEPNRQGRAGGRGGRA
jgi:ribonuclease E